ncbi:uncharacterized protein LOC106662327 [Cimex lectularius]|uniref:Centrosome-associated FAM110 C-terminal domain-containing protein n=1 Tax=Cimex lectularius TaxID=79782 RepID=A0A8I6RDH0_CIMLE|nr:uncharacterized protein LOC106662327 [Cimex lectularius]
MSAVQGLTRDLVRLRTHSAKRKSAVEILQATKSLYIKSPKCQDDSRLPVKREYTKKCKKKDTDQLQSKLRRLLDDSSKENISDWGCFEDLNFKFYTDCDVQYQSLPDLSISSKESTSYTLQQDASDPGEKMTISSEPSTDTSSSFSEESYGKPPSSSSSKKSYGKPPSQSSSLLSAGGSASKVEDRLSTWTQPKHRKITRSRSWAWEKSPDDPPSCRKPVLSVSKDLNDFFEHLGLSCEEYRALADSGPDSRTSSPVFFSSRSSDGSGRSSRAASAPDALEPGPSDPLSVVQTNARVVKWLCRLSQT